jgi:hypothetical protein
MAGASASAFASDQHCQLMHLHCALNGWQPQGELHAAYVGISL